MINFVTEVIFNESCSYLAIVLINDWLMQQNE